MSMLLTHAQAAGALRGGQYQRIFAVTTYIFAAVCFMLSIKWMSRPTSARKGNFVGEIGMAAAIVGCCCKAASCSYEWIVVGLRARRHHRGAAGHLDAHDRRPAANGVLPRMRCPGRAVVGTAHYSCPSVRGRIC